tara:strand:- start:3327 stop:4466 length:1140 start_codon:yes stop_codon:yes gene_type:complete
MGFITSAIIGGAAKRASEILDEERKEAISMTEDALKTWTQLGLPKAAERRKNRLADRKLAKSLEQDYGFSVEQIAVIMGQGKGEATRKHIDEQRNKYGKSYQIPYGDIVTISGEYEDTGLTIDQIIDNVHGKVNRGMSTSDAVKDVTGKEYTGGLTGLLGGDNSALMRQKMDAFGTAAGVDVNELRALASDDITYEDALRKGTVTLYDPFDTKVTQGLLNKFQLRAVLGLGGKGNIIDGAVQTTDMANDRVLASMDIAAAANDKYEEFQRSGGPNGGNLSKSKALQKTYEWIKGQTANYGKDRNKPIVGSGDAAYEGYDATQLPAIIEEQLRGADSKQMIAIQIAAEKALIKAYMEAGSTTPEQDAKKEMDRIRQRIKD